MGEKKQKQTVIKDSKFTTLLQQSQPLQLSSGTLCSSSLRPFIACGGYSSASGSNVGGQQRLFPPPAHWRWNAAVHIAETLPTQLCSIPVMLRFWRCLLKHSPSDGPLQATTTNSFFMFKCGRLTTHAQVAHKHITGIYLHIYVILKTTDRGIISVSQPQRRRTRNNREFYQQVLSIHERSHSGAWMGLCVARVCSGASPERTLPWGSNRRHAMETQAQGSSMSLALADRLARGSASVGATEKTKPKAGKRGLLSLAVPTSPIQAFTGKIFINDSITELLQTMCFTSSACYLKSLAATHRLCLL